MAMIKQKMNRVKYYRMKGKAPTQSNRAQVEITNKITTQRLRDPVVDTTRHGSKLSR